MAIPAALRGLRRHPLNYLQSLVHRYGSVVRLRFLVMDVLVLWQPDHVKHVLQDRHSIYTKESLDYRVLKRFLGEGLVTSDGELWLRQRRLMQPAFHRTSIADFAALMVERTRALLKDWDGPARFRRPVNVYHEMRRLSLDIVTRALFGVDVHEDARRVGHTFAILSEALAEQLYTPFFFLFLHPLLPTPSNRRARAALRDLDGIVGSIIARRRAQGSAANDDLLSLLLHARDEEADGAGMDDRQIRDEVMTVLLAGHETTAATLSWTWYLLDRNRDIADRVRSETRAVLGDRDPTVDDLPQLEAIRRVIEEAMRLYPPAWIISRVAKEEDEIGGYRVAPRTVVTLSPYLTQHSKEVWPEPERFDPDRFTAEHSADRPRFAYFPFAGGPRQCIGSEFALTETTLVVATILRRYRLELASRGEVVPQPLTTLRPRGGMPMIPSEA